MEIRWGSSFHLLSLRLIPVTHGTVRRYDVVCRRAFYTKTRSVPSETVWSQKHLKETLYYLWNSRDGSAQKYNVRFWYGPEVIITRARARGGFLVGRTHMRWWRDEVCRGEWCVLSDRRYIKRVRGESVLLTFEDSPFTHISLAPRKPLRHIYAPHLLLFILHFNFKCPLM